MFQSLPARPGRKKVRNFFFFGFFDSASHSDSPPLYYL